MTPILTGVSPHGVQFVPTPEPGPLIMLASGVIGLAGVVRRKLGR